MADVVSGASRTSVLGSGHAAAIARISVVAYLLVLLAIPFAALTQQGLAGGLGVVWRSVSSPVAVAALKLTLWTSALMALVNGVMGTATAWVLVRYRFP